MSDIGVRRPPSVDEEVALWAPSGDLTSAFVAPGYYTEQHGGAGRVNPDETATDFPDGAFEQCNHASHEYVLSVPAGRRIVFRIGGTEFELKADGTTLRSSKAAGGRSGFDVHGQHDDRAIAGV